MKFLNFLFSNKITLVLLVAFAVSMAVATFIENEHGTAVARSLVYEAFWFEVIMVWLAINFLGNIKKYKLFHRNRWSIGLFHISFVIIILAAGITRYFGQEGIIHIRQGSSENTYYTLAHWLQVQQVGENSGKRFEKPVTLIPNRFNSQNHKVLFPEAELKVTIAEFIPGAREEFVEGNQTLIDLALTMGLGREDFLIPEGDAIGMGEISLGTSKEPNHPIKIYKRDNIWVIESDRHLQVMEMNTQQMGVLHADEFQPLQLRTLYQWEGGAFLIKSIHENARMTYLSEQDENLAKNLPDVVKLTVSDSQDALVSEAYFKLVSFRPNWHPFTYQGKSYSITYGPKSQKLPFSLYLNAFEMERYPGSQSPSSYASEVMVMDGEEEFPYRIYMNNVLDHGGFRFYQSSYDTDEKGTVLSINQDRPGTYLTYLGYFLLSLGMFFTLFVKGSRFQLLNKKLGSIKKIHVLVLALLLFGGKLYAQESIEGELSIVPKEKADDYGRLVVQDLDGRMKPLNTLANEITRKLSGKSYIILPTVSGETKLSAEQFLLAVQLDPETYSHLPLIKIDRKKSLKAFEVLGKAPQESISFRDFLDDEGNYLLHELVEEANQLKPSERNEGHNELLKTDERFNIFYALLIGDFLRIFPNRLDHNNTWYTRQQYTQGFEEEDALFVKNITTLYHSGLQKGLLENNWEDASEALSYIRLFQEHAGKEVHPSKNLLEAELLYNKLNLGNRLFPPFWVLGTLMLAIGILQMFRQNNLLSRGWKVGKFLAWLGFFVFTFHLVLRWYIANHPPWSDGFEMLVFVAWGVLLFGLLFSNKSRFTIPLALLFSGTLLFVGFLDWLNPEITNLMPVLNSYWLKIHVAIIVSSYAPLALAAVIALLSLLLLLFKPMNPKSQWWKNMMELSLVNEMAITIGLFLLAIGTFLGGIWANESWGRYWAWDPKETWALISVIVYAFVLHLRLVPALKNPLIFNLASLWAFSSIVMTSFGVNYYLSGLHSYAKGDPVPVPIWVYWVVFTLFTISVAAIVRYKRFNKADKKQLVAS